MWRVLDAPVRAMTARAIRSCANMATALEWHRCRGCEDISIERSSKRARLHEVLSTVLVTEPLEHIAAQSSVATGSTEFGPSLSGVVPCAG